MIKFTNQNGDTIRVVVYVGRFPIEDRFEYLVCEGICPVYPGANMLDSNTELADLYRALVFGEAYRFSNEEDAMRYVAMAHREMPIVHGVEHFEFDRPLLCIDRDQALERIEELMAKQNMSS